MCERKALVSVRVWMVILCWSTSSHRPSSASCVLQVPDEAGSAPGAVGPQVYGHYSSCHSTGRGHLLSVWGCGSRDWGWSSISLHPFPFSISLHPFPFSTSLHPFPFSVHVE